MESAFTQVERSSLIRNNFLQVNVIWRSDEITRMSEVPSIELEGLIGNLGGVLNLWVGISFVTAIEIFEMFINLCSRLFTRRPNHVDVKKNTSGKPPQPIQAWSSGL